MERLEYDCYGGPEVMRLGSFTLPPPQPDELVISVAAASINPMDWKIRSGTMKMMTGSKFPRAMGTDFAGTVKLVGTNVSQFKPGDAVVGTVSMKAGGAFAPMLVTTQDLVVKKPSNLPFAEASTLPIAGVTAWQVLVKCASLERGQRVFINGALGAVGQAAVSIAISMGAEVIGRVGGRSLSQAESLGLRMTLDYAQPIPHDLDRTFDVVFDAHGSLTAAEGDRLIKRGGKVIDIVPTRTKFLRALVSRSRKFIFADVKAPNLQRVVDLAASRNVTIPIVKTISLQDAPATLSTLEHSGGLNGKAVILF